MYGTHAATVDWGFVPSRAMAGMRRKRDAHSIQKGFHTGFRCRFPRKRLSSYRL